MPSPLDYLKFADNTYSDPVQSIPDGWELIHTEENKKTSYTGKVFIKKNKWPWEIVIAHKGSNDWKDFLIDDVDIALKKMPPQFEDAKKLTEKIMKQFPLMYITQTGHSLGAFLAEVTAVNFGQKAVTFDGPGSAKQIDKIIKQKESFGLKVPPPNITAYISDPNLVNSAGTYLGRKGETIYLSGEKEKFSYNVLKGYKLAKEVHLTNHIYKYFDPKTGQPLPHCVMRKADPIVRTYLPTPVSVENPLVDPITRAKKNSENLKTIFN
jgi:hypothetical protein